MMSVISYAVTKAFPAIKSFLIYLSKIRVIEHAAQLAGITILEIVSQSMMHEIFTVYEANSATCRLFEITNFGLYILSCLFLVIKCLIHLYFGTKKEITESKRETRIR